MASEPYRIDIPDWHPAALNLLMRNRWRSARLKKIDRDMVNAYAIRLGIPAATGPRRVRITVERKRNRPGRVPDPDSYLKSTLDSLVKAGMLVDDDRHGVVCDPVQYVQGDRMATRIELWDLGS
jgi:Holliday junction resolvase RusA-like endonuclease